MNEVNSEEFMHLQKNIESTIHEGLVKLGYNKGEQISIYYDLESLSHILNRPMDHQNSIEPLKKFQAFSSQQCGTAMVIEAEKGRYKFTLKDTAVECIYNKYKNHIFLKQLICLLANKNVTMDQIVEVFRQQSEEVICEKVENSEFDYVVYYADPSIDEFKYCFTFDGMGIYYHRFMDYHYEKLVHSEHCNFKPIQ